MNSATALRRALLQEREALEGRLGQVNSLLKQGTFPSAALALSSPLASTSSNATLDSLEQLSLAIGVTPEMLRLALLVALLAFIWTRGRAVVRALVVLSITLTVTIWANCRRLKRGMKSRFV